MKSPYLLIKELCYLSIALLLTCYVHADVDDSWAHATLEKMSLDEKLGQLFMINVFLKDDQKSIQKIEDYISNYYIGGIAYVGHGESVTQVKLTNHYQEISKYPILIAQDLEWGLSMRLTDAIRFPKNITLGAIHDKELVYEMGREIGNQAKLIGVHMNLSPVLDVNTNPENLSINVRSFGGSPQEVAENGVAMILGLQDSGIIASAKHFPGLGDITVDPHISLPLNNNDIKRVHDVDLYPFLKAIEAGVLSIQTDHMLIPSLEPIQNLPSSLSSKVVNDLLKKELGFNGLVISGALRMGALIKNFSEEEIVLKAFTAGSDMLLMPKDLLKAYKTLKSALNDGKISEQEINERVLKILQLKEKMKLNLHRTVSVPSQEDLHSTHARNLKKRLFERAVSVACNKNNLIPVSTKNPIAYVQIGNNPSGTYLKKLSESLILDSFFLPIDQKDEEKECLLLKKINEYSLIILSIYPVDIRGANNSNKSSKQPGIHGVSDYLIHLTDLLKDYDDKIIVSYFGNPFGVHFFDKFSTFVMCYEDDEDVQEAAANILTSCSSRLEISNN